MQTSASWMRESFCLLQHQPPSKHQTDGPNSQIHLPRGVNQTATQPRYFNITVGLCTKVLEDLDPAQYLLKLLTSRPLQNTDFKGLNGLSY